jgi:hypothetical protein
MKEKGYRTSLYSWILSLLGYAQEFTPERCALCGAKRKGNFITGYYFDCND